MKENDFEIIDTDEFSPEEKLQFSHQQLVMKTMNKCIDAGSNEMREGYWNIKYDKNNNPIKVYIEDARKVLIECIETLEMVMVCDYDKGTKDKIKELKDELEKKYKALIDIEKKNWEDIPTAIKNRREENGIYFREEYLNKNLPFYQDYIEEQIRTAREIFKELTNLTKELDFYREEALVETAD